MRSVGDTFRRVRRLPALGRIHVMARTSKYSEELRDREGRAVRLGACHNVFVRCNARLRQRCRTKTGDCASR